MATLDQLEDLVVSIAKENPWAKTAILLVMEKCIDRIVHEIPDKESDEYNKDVLEGKYRPKQ